MLRDLILYFYFTGSGLLFFNYTINLVNKEEEYHSGTEVLNEGLITINPQFQSPTEKLQLLFTLREGTRRRKRSTLEVDFCEVSINGNCCIHILFALRLDWAFVNNA
jgi:hypothetical protein